MLNIKELIFSFIDIILFDNYYQTDFSLELDEEIFLKEKYIYSETEINLLLHLVNFLAFLKGYNSQVNTLYLIERITNTMVSHRKQTDIYSDNLSLGELDINFLIEEIAKVGSLKDISSVRLKSFYSEYSVLENIIFVGIIYDVYKKIQISQKNLLNRNPQLNDLTLMQKVNISLHFLKNILSKPLMKDLLVKYINDYKGKSVLDYDNVISLTLSSKLNKTYKTFFKRYLTFIEKEKFFNIEKVNTSKLYEYFIIKSIHKYLEKYGKIENKNPIYKRGKIFEGTINRKSFEVHYQSSSLLVTNKMEKIILDLQNLQELNKNIVYGIPDILLKFGNRIVFIDAKYKSDFDAREDVYQMIGYTQIFDLEEYNLIVIYPCKEKIFNGNTQTKLYKFFTNGKPVKIIVTCLDNLEDSDILYSKMLKDLLNVC